MIRMRELAVQSANSTLTDVNREATQAEYSQIIEEIDRIALSTTYNDQVLLTGFGNNVNESTSTAVTASDTSGITNIKISGASTGTYTFVDAGGNGDDDSQITLGNGTVTQTISIGTLLDGNQVATGSTVVANFDRLGIQIDLAGANVANATGSYLDGDLADQTILIEGATGGSFQVGPDDGINNRIEATLEDMRATGAFLSLDNTAVATITGSRSAITQIDQAITKVSGQRGNLGAWMNRLAFTISFTENEIENIQASEASISDADVASEITSFTRAQILSQAATAMLAQANVVPQTALSLLQ